MFSCELVFGHEIIFYSFCLFISIKNYRDMTTFAADGTPLEGKSRYETIKHLGEGQFANVFMAKDLATGDIVAIKKV